MPRRPCIECKRLIPRGSLCDQCRADRDAQRITHEPWRRVYHTAEWVHAHQACLTRDGGQCRRLLPTGERCPETTHLQAHHTTPLRILWREHAADWDRFVTAATDLAILVSLCPRDHHLAERALRAET